MTPCHENPCVANEYQMSLRTARLELAYENSLSQTKQLLAGEHLRKLRVEQVLLEADNEGLVTMLERTDKNLIRAMEAESNMRKQLNEACNEIVRLQGALRANSREIEGLKKEIMSLNDSSHESKRLLAEKLNTSRELANLQPELERLKAQSASYQSLLSEKLSLERQLKSLEVQLQTERRAFERTQVKDSRQVEEEAKLSVQLEDLRNEVAKEVRERQRLEQENYKQSIDQGNERAALENKLEAFRKKLRSTKDKLKVAQDELQQRRSIVKNEYMSGTASRTQGNPLQRTNSCFDAMTIATPGAVNVTEINKRSSALPGDKSTFSITPFLSRTSAAPDSPSSSVIDADEQRASGVSCGTGDASDTDDGDDDKSIRQRRAQKEFNTDAARDLKEPKAVVHVDRSVGTSAKLGNVPERSDSGDRSLDHNDSSNELSMLKQAKPRKRKLLGPQRNTTLFDDEDDGPDGRKHGRKVALGAKRKLAPGTSQIYTTSSGLRPDLGRVFVASAEFSPLKRDRKRL